ncbi:hypothetical protein [Haladaptatus sp. NG-SE-30]
MAIHQSQLKEKRSVKFGIDVVEGPNVDVFFLSQDQLAAYTAGGEFEYRYTSGLTVSGGWTEDSGVPAGKYAVIFDNTDRGEAVPDRLSMRGHAWVEVEAVD